MGKTIVITGGAGFIGSHLVRRLVSNYPNYNIVNLDSLTYAGNLENVVDLDKKENYFFERVDIVNESELDKIFSKYSVTDVIHLAAESHVDRSISDPMSFVNTNVIGTVNLLNIAKKYWGKSKENRFYHVSTDEVYGSLGSEGLFTETTSYDPQSPYSASKAASDHFVRAYTNTYQLNTVISNCSNNYGPNQFPEKLIPLCINNILNDKAIPVYGKGDNIRDWLFVEDHVAAIDLIFHRAENGETYNIGGFNEWKNIEIVQLICDKMDEALGRKQGVSRQLISFVEDRAGHDKRYAIDASNLKNRLGWQPSLQFEEGITKTINWYMNNIHWIENIESGKYQSYSV